MCLKKSATSADGITAAVAVMPAERLHPSSDCGMWHSPRERACAKLAAMGEGAWTIKLTLGLTRPCDRHRLIQRDLVSEGYRSSTCVDRAARRHPLSAASHARYSKLAAVATRPGRFIEAHLSDLHGSPGAAAFPRNGFTLPTVLSQASRFIPAAVPTPPRLHRRTPRNSKILEA